MRSALASLAILAAFAVPAAHANTIDYTVTGGGHTVTFALDSNPPASHVGDGYVEFYYDLTATIDGTTVTDAYLQFGEPGTNFLNFYFFKGSTYLEGENGDTFYTTIAGVTTLATGTFQLGDGATVTAVEAPAPSAVPEPSSFILLGTGILGAAAAARRRLFATR